MIVVDGGRGQLSAAGQALAELGLEACEIVALAKARTRGGEKLRGERVFVPGRREPIVLPEHSYGYRLITRLRDEAHRFAIAYHRTLRRKAAARSPLTEIPGVGPKIAERLMDHFGTLDKIRGASVDELQAVRGISERLAQVIHRTLSA